MTLLRLVIEWIRLANVNVHAPGPGLLNSCIQRVSSAFANVSPLTSATNAGCNLFLNFVKTWNHELTIFFFFLKAFFAFHSLLLKEKFLCWQWAFIHFYLLFHLFFLSLSKLVLCLNKIFDFLSALHLTSFSKDFVCFFVTALSFYLDVLKHQLRKLTCTLFFFHAFLNLQLQPLKVFFHSVLEVELRSMHFEVEFTANASLWHRHVERMVVHSIVSVHACNIMSL